MSDHTLQDRQDAPIWNAIEASNFKQALKLVDKRLSKKRTDYLEVGLHLFHTLAHIMARFKIVRKSHVTQTHFFTMLILDVAGSESVYPV
jgi:hypothetical protein